jgi:peptidoglycan/LPS O-acetylase OafA/YrhL
MSHTWYLSIDFQLFIVSPFLIYPAWKYGWKYVWVFPVVTLLVCIYLFVIALVFNVWLNAGPEDAADFNFFLTWIYYPTHARMGPWFLGMMLGYIMYTNRNKKIILNPIFNAVMWILCLTVFAAVTMGSQILFYPFSRDNVTLLSHAFYTGFYRNGWALACTWMIFACHNGTGGIIRWFLQLPQWQVLGRMGLSLYLLSFMFQHFIVMNAKQPYYFDEFGMIHLFWGDMVASILLSIVGYLAFEVPFLTVESYIYDKLVGRRRKVTKI